jgi:hypothetical protein
MIVQQILRRSCLLVGLTAMAVAGFATSASAHSGEFAKFNYCPSTKAEVFKCIDSVTNSGYITIGKKKTPIVNPVTLQGGYSATNREKKRISSFFEATNGVTLSKTPQPVPGGLAGLVNCDEISNFFERIACELFFENEATGVNATLELAKPASAIEVSEFNLANEEGTALTLPVKVHLENLFLGSTCYIGSNSAPIYWHLTTGESVPPSPFTPISGTSGSGEFIENSEIGVLKGAVLVDKTWAAPEPNGCTEPFSILVDPIIGLKLGIANNAGENIADLENTISFATAEAVNKH